MSRMQSWEKFQCSLAMSVLLLLGLKPKARQLLREILNALIGRVWKVGAEEYMTRLGERE